ncbi:MAG: methyltransferase family protein [Alphaproteobacteria bacterium]
MNLENQRNRLRVTKIVLMAIQVALIAILFRVGFKDFLAVANSPREVDPWYGNWPVVLTSSIIFILFFFFLTRPRRPKEWTGAGLAAAFFISLFTEMFGVPLTIYLLAPLLGVDPRFFGMYESHLWAYLLAQSGIISLKAGVFLVMLVSTALLIVGFILLVLGWKQVYRGRGRLVATGLYGKLRHPQYAGLILTVVAFLIQWPTILTVGLAPFLIGRYMLLAREEDRELEKEFGEQFRHYRETVPAFIPSMRFRQG